MFILIIGVIIPLVSQCDQVPRYVTRDLSNVHFYLTPVRAWRVPYSVPLNRELSPSLTHARGFLKKNSKLIKSREKKLPHGRHYYNYYYMESLPCGNFFFKKKNFYMESRQSFSFLGHASTNEKKDDHTGATISFLFLGVGKMNPG